MKEIEYVNATNLVRIRNALTLVQECAFIYEQEEDLQRDAVQALIFLEEKISKQIKLV